MPFHAILQTRREPPEFQEIGVMEHREGEAWRQTGLRVVHRFGNVAPEMAPFQIIFNPTSAGELARLPKDLQLQVLGQFRGLPQELQREEGQYGHLTRNGRTLTRYRLGDYRIYFERHPLGIIVHRVLSKHSLKDFLFRSNLASEEDAALAENPKFWDLIEQTRREATKKA